MAQPEFKLYRPDLLESYAGFLQEPLVQKENRNILIFGVDHGVLGMPFVAKNDVETAIERQFGNDGLQGIIMDGFPIIPVRSNGDLPRVPQDFLTKDDSADIMQWVVNRSYEKGTFIIGADPVNIVPGFLPAVKDEIKGTSSSYEQELKDLDNSPQMQALSFDHGFGEWASYGLDAGAMATIGGEALGLAIAVGFVRVPKFSRRMFLGLGGAAVVGGTWKLYDIGKQQIKAAQDADLSSMLQIYESGGYYDPQKGFILPGVLRQLDFQSILQNGAIDYNSPAFKRASQDSSVHQISVAYRNAVIAESLARPGYALPNLTGESNIAVVMGLGHLTVPKELSISYLTEHDNERHQMIQTLTWGLLNSIRNGNLPDTKPEDVDKFKDWLKGYIQVYSVAPDRFVRIYPVGLPWVEEMVEKL